MNQNTQNHSLREEIAKRLWQIYIRNEYGIEEMQDSYEYEYGVHDWTKYTEQDKKGYLEEADEILELFEKRIEELYQNDEVLGYSGDAEVSYGITLFHDMIKKELLK